MITPTKSKVSKTSAKDEPVKENLKDKRRPQVKKGGKSADSHSPTLNIVTPVPDSNPDKCVEDSQLESTQRYVFDIFDTRH